MTITELVQLMQNRVAMLSTARLEAFGTGDVNRINAIDGDLLTTQTTFANLLTLTTPSV